MNRRSSFIFFSLVIAAVVAFLFVSLSASKETERKLRLQKEQALSAKLAELAEKEAKLFDLTRQKVDADKESQAKLDAMKVSLKSYEENERALSSKLNLLIKEKEALESENTSKDNHIADLSQKIHELEIDKSDLLATIKKLKSDLATAKTARAAQPASQPIEEKSEERDTRNLENELSAPVKLGQIVVQKSSGTAARVEHVNKVYGFIIVNAWSKDGLHTNCAINIIRGKKLIGTAVIQKVRDNVSAAVIIPELLKEDILVGDLVSLS